MTTTAELANEIERRARGDIAAGSPEDLTEAMSRWAAILRTSVAATSGDPGPRPSAEFPAVDPARDLPRAVEVLRRDAPTRHPYDALLYGMAADMLEAITPGASGLVVDLASEIDARAGEADSPVATVGVSVLRRWALTARFLASRADTHEQHCHDVLALFGMENGDVVDAVRRRLATTPGDDRGRELAEINEREIGDLYRATWPLSVDTDADVRELAITAEQLREMGVSLVRTAYLRALAAPPAPGDVAAMLAEFHAALGQTFGDGGTSAEGRADMQQAETDELRVELLAGDHVGIARELADVVYLAYGTAFSHGIDLDAVVAEVHRANMTKQRGPDGLLATEPNGKVIKGAGFRPPDVASVLAAPAETDSLGGRDA